MAPGTPDGTPLDALAVVGLACRFPRAPGV